MIFEGRDTLALSGGGGNGFVELGLLQELAMTYCPSSPLHLQFRRYIGSSVGAFIGAALCFGLALEGIMHLLFTLPLQELMIESGNLLNLLDHGGLLNLDEVEAVIDTSLQGIGLRPGINLRDFLLRCDGREFTATTSNLILERTEYLNADTDPHLRLSRAIALSMSYPGIVSLTPFREGVCTDGGLFCNLPMNYYPIAKTLAISLVIIGSLETQGERAGTETSPESGTESGAETGDGVEGLKRRQQQKRARHGGPSARARMGAKVKSLTGSAGLDVRSSGALMLNALASRLLSDQILTFRRDPECLILTGFCQKSGMKPVVEPEEALARVVQGRNSVKVLQIAGGCCLQLVHRFFRPSADGSVSASLATSSIVDHGS